MVVEWIDAHTTELDELTPEMITDSLHFGYPTTSIGHLVRSDEKGVSLATDVQTGKDGAIHYRCAHFIPRGMVVKEKVIKPDPPKPRTRKVKVVDKCLPSLS